MSKIGHTTSAGTSVLDDLGRDRSFVIKAKLAIRIAKSVQELRLNQREAATRMGIPQAKLSQLTRGNFEGLSESKLEECLAALGHDVTISIGPRHEGAGTRRVSEVA
jgi:predicted XRE-type DNA-binding protein